MELLHSLQFKQKWYLSPKWSFKYPFSSLWNIHLSRKQKIVMVSISMSVGAVALLAKYLRRKRSKAATILTLPKPAFLTSRKGRPPLHSASGDAISGFRPSSPSVQRSSRQRSSSMSVSGDRQSNTCVQPNGAPMTPQQLGAMGVEALETAINYWEEALENYRVTSAGALAIPSADEAEFYRSLQRVLEAAYALQDETEHLFLHQHSVLFQSDPSSPQRDNRDEVSFRFSRSRSVTLSDAESFVSAQGDYADLEDFFGDADEDDQQFAFYHAAMRVLEETNIPYRSLRTDLLGCNSDTEYVGKLHCVRLAFQYLVQNPGSKQWLAEIGRRILGDLMSQAEKDPRLALVAYDAMLEFLSDPSSLPIMEAELGDRQVKAITFYDVVLDFILMDAFEDLESPPSSVVAVINNRWLSVGFKEGALATAVWSVLKAKRRKLKYPHGFMAHFYDISEHLSPVMAWGFLGPDARLKAVLNDFKDQIIGFLQDIFSFKKVRYSTQEHLACDILNLTKERYQVLSQSMESSASTVV